ncbi:SPOR domain-containing protein [Vibrio europaeus]|uniref:Cytochrome C biogenesis protein CcdA n=1 Tax=Vibrio europaeus TaxID=300876 RepID=A0A178JA87_9VIBR|nr:SPOR domain-containing protein [Vibrio europaeus]MDC5704903.1 SPOR domain-containing protein [Vibrio europaeus]MDC5710182.1 SPOR domain-containing protein [Vibrio europaeus]MDC5715272.1 SPOR domain-containing protein [Vibrio europaeus]MDC5718874.1 SPOR domain-containing protein [Vibrio europaeus]MDC5724679.1 SPOR domain-containing protein [Vibrio europaeus]
MKKIAIVGLSVVLSACVSSDYVTDVSSESYREDYKTAKVEQPVVTQQGMTSGISEDNVAKVVNTAPAQQSQTVKMQAKPKPAVAIIPPTAKQQAMNPRYGFTIQVVAVGSQTKVDHFARKLPREDNQPVWENYKVVNGTKWYTILYGDYATRTAAKAAISELPAEFRTLKPFVKSIDDIKNSQYPTLNKLN